jgi:hypothetical protein
MEIGNSLLGMNIHREYVSIQMFPLGLEILIDDCIDISIVIAGLNIGLVLRKNISLFN